MSALPGRLVAIDWGSTSLRAFLLGDGGQVLAERRSDAGASTLDASAPRFETALRELVGEWLRRQPGLPMLACGMVGSAHGWREAPYAECPADIAGLHAQAVTVPFDGAELKILPGLRCRGADGAPDVMRGEETQLAGALATRPDLAPRSTLVLPGTHSKWVRLRGGQVVDFATRMTGELYAVLRQHSVLGRLMAPAPAAQLQGEDFDRGLDAARQAGGRDLGRQLFSVRTLGLFGACPPEGLGDYLSGLLIGHELLAGLDAAEPGQPLVLIGESTLCERYRRGLQRYGVDGAATIGNTAPAGLWQQAAAAGWL
ncbi:2-dehydro-3-deoxygalactonokinase [Ideonella sp.]|uniref:2-dehydro-3-deoxygalactonokinase n=1 Tax=Ideonella sp. TaxID=1929293 RepID=UPI002B4A2A11|nr:2-dehydro-3-deoxygalactonokinase [Ideonella sp.]HJV71774.1 2-dehydro-3-deoxygalactonokinase [Ideonella sp.]